MNQISNTIKPENLTTIMIKLGEYFYTSKVK